MSGSKENSPAKTMEARSYQLELLEYVMERNAVIYLPTGSGKTFVAIMALKRFSHQLQKTIENGGKRAIFMCNTVELARQQAIEVKKNTNYNVGFYVGDRNVDYWTRNKWEEEIRDNQVFIGTTQIFVDIVAQNYIKITDLSIVIIDECHHATKKHPMHEFMRLFQYVDQTKLPRVIGLTGVLLKGNKLGNIQQELTNLESTFRGNIVTVSTMEQFRNVMVYSTKPTEELVTYEDELHIFPLVNQIKREILDCFAVVSNWNLGHIPEKPTKGLAALREPNKKNYIKNLLNDFIYQMEDFGLYAAGIAIMSPITEFEIKKRQSETKALRDLYRYVITVCERIRHNIIKKLKDMLDEENVKDSQCHTLDIILNFSSPKMRSLLMYMKSSFENLSSSDICCLIFVERRYSAKCVYYVVQKFVEVTPELRDIIKPQFMVGRNSILPSIESILDKKWNKSTIENFRSGDCNVIICSSVLEEGIDVQACNYVFAFDPLKTFNSYVQTKGRARKSNSIYAIFTPKIDEAKTIQRVRTYQKVHAMIKEFLVGRILDRDDPKIEDIAEQFIEEIKPYVVPSGACLLPNSALNLIHRYCQMLPTDAFGGVAPWFCKLNPDEMGKHLVSVKLPLQSTVKETIISDPMESTKLAKVSAAFKACIKLYEQGELNEKLLPVTKRECIAKVSEELFQHWKNYNDDVTSKSIGKQARRVYERMCPEELYNAMPRVGQPCYAYEIKFTPLFEHNDYNAHYIDNLKTPNNYAIVLNKPLPRLAEMPLFMNQGKLSVKISEEPLQFSIPTAEHLEHLCKYHVMLFRDLVDCWKNFFVMDNRNKENSFLIVPLKEQQIDWTLVQQFQSLTPMRSYSVAERRQQGYRPEDYLGKVVNKWYSNIESERFIVTKVLRDMTPLSEFEGESYQNYAHFIESKYGDRVGHVVNKNQFLLEVRALTTRRNFFVNAIGKSQFANKKHSAVRLIPELCHNFMYPGDMWLKALFLPSILHRLHFMLHADTLRRRINAFLGLGNNALYRPTPLTIDTSLARVVDSDGNATEIVEAEIKKLPAMPTSQAKSHFEVHNLSEEVTWKDYLEPEDYSRKPDAIYPVEIDYYYKFITGLATELSVLRLEEDEEERWTVSQLNMPTKQNKAKTVANLSTLSISDVSLESRRRIEILERSQGRIPLSDVEQHELVAALTASGANDVFDMERFEVLGDSFLKFSISLYLANKYPKWNEGFLTIIKGRLVSNRNLLYCMFNLDIPKRICVSLFKPNREWLPPMVSLPDNLLELVQQNPSAISSGELYSMELSEKEIFSGACAPQKLESFIQSACSREPFNVTIDSDVDNGMNSFIYKETMADKVVADTLEAILGVCVKNCGIHNGFRMLEFFGICKPDPQKPLTHLLDLKLNSETMRTSISSREVDSFLINYRKLEENLGYEFRDRAFLLQALTHPSFPTNRITGCYQELEFIGDAILDFLISCYIFERNKHMTPGMLTDLRSALVNNITLGCVCVRHRFHLFLLAENSLLAESIKNFADFQETQNHRVTEQVRILMEESIAGNDEQAPFNLAVNVEVPKALGDIVEALIAAVYMDSRDIGTTWNVIYRLLEQEINEFSYQVPIDPVRQLYEHKNAAPKFSDAIIDNEVIMIKCSFTCVDKRIEVNGFGNNAKQAKKSAAKHALKILSKQSS